MPTVSGIVTDESGNVTTWAASWTVAAPPTAATMQYGVSATPTGNGFENGYLEQVADIGATVGYLYGQDPRYADFDGIPATHDLWLQTKATTRAQYDAMIASMPATRAGKVFLHYHNEPEDQIGSGSMTMAQWQSRCDQLFAAIAASGKTYIVPSIEIMYYTLQQTNKGSFGANGERKVANYIRPGLKQIGWSAYAEKKLDSTGQHEVAGTSTTTMPNTIKAWHAANPGYGFSIITGWAVDTAYLSDQITLDRRRTWLRDSATNLKAAGAQHYMWFDIPWSNGDYRIETDPGLLAVWNDLTEEN